MSDRVAGLGIHTFTLVTAASSVRLLEVTSPLLRRGLPSRCRPQDEGGDPERDERDGARRRRGRPGWWAPVGSVVMAGLLRSAAHAAARTRGHEDQRRHGGAQRPPITRAPERRVRSPLPHPKAIASCR